MASDSIILHGCLKEAGHIFNHYLIKNIRADVRQHVTSEHKHDKKESGQALHQLQWQEDRWITLEQAQDKCPQGRRCSIHNL
jgi:hypothetical protein